MDEQARENIELLIDAYMINIKHSINIMETYEHKIHFKNYLIKKAKEL